MKMWLFSQDQVLLYPPNANLEGSTSGIFYLVGMTRTKTRGLLKEAGP